MNDADEPTTELFLPSVMNRADCEKHNAIKGIPCWHIPKIKNGYHGAVCNNRARRAGFRHPISETALRKRGDKKR